MTVKSEAQQLTAAIESTLGTLPTTGWRSQRFLPGGIKSFGQTLKTVADESVTKNAQDEAGDVVDHDSKPSVDMVVCKDALDNFGTGIARGAEKFAATTKRWYPTAVTTTDFTVDSLGAIAANLLVYARGFATAGNNGVFLVGSSSTSTAVKASGLAAETVSPANSAQLEVCGVQGATADITLDASGNLTSTILDFTTLGLVAGQTIYLPNNAAGTFFANVLYCGFARVRVIAAHKLTLECRSWTVGSADTGSGKTIRILFGSALRFIAIDDADALEQSYALELSQPGSGAAGATEYLYARGNAIGKFMLQADLTSQLKMTLDFTGTKCDDPTTSRTSGASSAIPSIAFAPYNTVGDERRLKLIDTSEIDVVTKVNNWKFTYDHHVNPLKVQGTEGAVEQIFGKTQGMYDMTAYLGPPGSGGTSAQLAAHNYTTLQFIAAFGNAQGGFCIDSPEVKISNAVPQGTANGPVTLPLQIKANRSAFYGFTTIITRFPYLPALS